MVVGSFFSESGGFLSCCTAEKERKKNKHREQQGNDSGCLMKKDFSPPPPISGITNSPDSLATSGFTSHYMIFGVYFSYFFSKRIIFIVFNPKIFLQ